MKRCTDCPNTEVRIKGNGEADMWCPACTYGRMIRVSRPEPPHPQPSAAVSTRAYICAHLRSLPYSLFRRRRWEILRVRRQTTP